MANKTFLIVGILFLMSFSIVKNASRNGEFPSLEKWSKEEIEKANTAKDCLYMTEEEQKVVFYTNLARINPDLFKETLLTEYVEENTIKRTNYLISLYSDLKKAQAMDPLKPDSILFILAKNYAISHGAKGQTGHINFSQRMKSYSLSGENCHYGADKALEIVMDLLIDEGVAGYGHRKNMLMGDFKIIGTSIQPHKTYGVCCVMDFAGDSYSKQPAHSKKKKKLWF